jgi:hypothetical protein
MTEAIEVVAPQGAPQAAGPMEKVLTLYALETDEGEVEAAKLTLEMCAETARWLEVSEALAPDQARMKSELARGADCVRVGWLHQIKDHCGKEDAEEFAARWEEAFARARAAPKEDFAENLNAAIAKQAKSKAEPEPEPVALPVAEVEPSKALTIIEPTKETVETPIEKAAREMNDKHAVISNLGGKCVIMEWVPSPISKRGKTRGGMILRFPGGRESDSFWECRGPGILTVCRTPS